MNVTNNDVNQRINEKLNKQMKQPIVNTHLFSTMCREQSGGAFSLHNAVNGF